MTKPLDPKVKLERRFKRHVSSPNNNGCWNWTGTVSKSGYGVIHMQRKGKNFRCRAHRIAYEMFVGRIPGNLEVRHTCDNPRCVNPQHLLLGTHLENMQDMALRKRAASSAGERNPSAKLTREQVERIKSLHASGLKQTTIAKIFAVRQTTVSNIVLGKNWK